MLYMLYQGKVHVRLFIDGMFDDEMALIKNSIHSYKMHLYGALCVVAHHIVYYNFWQIMKLKKIFQLMILLNILLKH